MALKLQTTSESPERPVKTQTAGLYLKNFLTELDWGESQESVSRTSSQVMLILLVQGAQFKNHRVLDQITTLSLYFTWKAIPSPSPTLARLTSLLSKLTYEFVFRKHVLLQQTTSRHVLPIIKLICQKNTLQKVLNGTLMHRVDICYHM